MDPIFSGRGSYTADALKELRKYYFSPRWKVSYEFLSIACILLGLLGLLLSTFRMGFVFLSGGICFPSMMLFFEHLHLSII